MKYRIIKTFLSILGVVILSFSPLYASPEKNTNKAPGAVKREKSPRFRDGELIIKFKKKADESEQRLVAERLNNKTGATKKREFKKLRMQHLKLKKGMTVEQAIALFSADPDIEYAQPNYIYRMNAAPNDPDYPILWNLAKIKVPQAWDLSTGSSSFVVGTIDTGIDYNHPDLKANLWINTTEQSGTATVDDDANGYTDDLYGWNTLADSGDPFDDQSHGSHVAGIIGAAGNNSVGVVGVNWNVKIMACKAFDNTGNGLASDIIKCLEYFSVMKERGVPLVATNNSYSGDPYDQAMIDAINLMPDVLFIAAASNNSNDNDTYPYYPAGYKLPNVIAVAATDADDRLGSFSNYGKYSVHVAAPGVSVVSTISQYPDILPENAYSSMSGTSMAAPHVAGLAALLKAHDPSRDWKAIRNLILSGAEPAAAVADITITGGRINAVNSLACSNRTVTAILDYPRTITAGVSATVSVLNIRCGVPAGPVSVTIEGIGAIPFADDGAGADLAANDGIYTATWTPTDEVARVATVTAAGFSKTFEVPTLKIVSATAKPPAQTITPAVFMAPGGGPYVQTHSVIGGKPPLTWTATTALPSGLTIDPASGTISGTPATPGNYGITVQVKDILEYTATFSSTLTVAAGIKNDWPKSLEPRTSQDIFSQFSFPPVLADLDGNGSDEIIVAVRKTDSDNSALYLLDSSGVLASRSDFLNSLSTPAVADLDGDGTPEIIVAEQSRVADTNPALMIHVLDSQTLGDVPWFIPGSYSNNNYQFKTVTVEDLDGDGTPEIIAMGKAYALAYDDPEYERNVLFVLNADGSIATGWPKVFDTDTNNDRGAVVGDLYGTGTRQIVVIDNGGMVRIYSKDGTELQAWGYNPKAQGTGEFPVNPVLADLDGDGALEIIIAYAEYDTPGVQRIAAFRPDGTLLSGWPHGFPGKVAQSFSAADLFKEGKSVVIIPFSSTERGSEILVLRADGSYAPGWPFSLGNALFNNYHEPLVADLNGDGINEVLVNVQRPACAEGEECYTFNAFVEAIGADGLPVSGFPKPIPGNVQLWSPPAIGDIDGDGLADVLVKSEDGSIFAWTESTPYLNRNFPWPQYRHDIRHSGAAKLVTTPPGLTINPVTSPAAASSQTISGARPNGIPVSITLNSQPVTPSYPTATTWQAQLTSMSEGTNRIRATAASLVAVGAVVVDTRAPVVEITKPANGFVSSYYQQVMVWRISDTSATSSRAFLDDVELAVTSGEYMPDLANGTHLLRVEVTDILGRTTTASRSFTIDASIPVVTIQSPENGKSYQSPLQLLYQLNKASIPTVDVLLDGVAISQRSGENLPPPGNGSHLLEITATDDVGQSGSASVTFTIAPPTFPTATTGTANAITTTTSTLNGTVSSNGAQTAVTFQYGLTTGYTSGTATASQSPLALDASGSAVSAAITGLTCNTTYHFRVVGQNSAGTTNGSDATFTTSACASTGTTYTWSATGGTSNTIYRTAPDGTTISLGSFPAATLSYTDNAALSNTIYTYCVKADNNDPCLQSTSIRTPLYNGWNILGVPYNTTEITASTLFSNTVSAVYEWMPTGTKNDAGYNADISGYYITVGTLTPGKGYFVRAGNTSTMLINNGGTANGASINVTLKPGYTLISSSQPVSMTNIGTNWLIDGHPLGEAIAPAPLYTNFSESVIGGAVYWWNGTTYESWSVLGVNPTIEPWKAYWILNTDTVDHVLTIQ